MTIENHMDVWLDGADDGTRVRVLGEEGVIEIGFAEVQRYHGHGALAMLAIIYQGLRGALALLSPDGPAPRDELSVLSGHPGPGVRDAFEFVTRALTRGAYVVDRGLPGARLHPTADMSYSFVLTRGNRRVSATLLPDILPARFFTLLGATDPASIAEGRHLRRAIAARVLQHPPEAVFEFRLDESAAA